MAILILASSSDPHVDLVTNWLDKFGQEYARFSTSEIAEDDPFAYCPVSGEWKSTSSGRLMNFETYGAIWNRRMFRPPLREVAPDVRRWAQLEFDFAVQGALQSGNGYWLNHPVRNRIASQKVLQLRLATRDVGFTIPKTLVCSSPSQARDFIDEIGQANCITKAVADPRLPHGESERGIYTSSLANCDLSTLSNLKFGPAIFQEKIERAFELRVTVVGKSIFAAKIEVTSKEPNVDWRISESSDVSYSVFDPDSDFKARCMLLMAKLGLDFGCLDFVVSQQGHIYFLEINPNGQWGWIELETGLEISRAIAHTLSNACIA